VDDEGAERSWGMRRNKAICQNASSYASVSLSSLSRLFRLCAIFAFALIVMLSAITDESALRMRGKESTGIREGESKNFASQVGVSPYSMFQKFFIVSFCKNKERARTLMTYFRFVRYFQTLTMNCIFLRPSIHETYIFSLL
jgi:hypothetical protein